MKNSTQLPKTLFLKCLTQLPGYWIIVIIVTLTGAVWLLHTGPIVVVQGTQTLNKTVPFGYMLTAFPVLGMLIAELLSLLQSALTRKTPNRLWRIGELCFAVFILILIAHFRLSLKIPVSGHAVLISYFILRRMFIKAENLQYRKQELAVAVGFLAIIFYYKLICWQDPLSLTLGVITGGLLSLGSTIFARY